MEKNASLSSLAKERTSILETMKFLFQKRNCQTTGKLVSTNLSDLSEKGEAFLVDKEGKVIFRFMDGMLSREAESQTILT